MTKQEHRQLTENMLLLCKQYEQLGLFIRSESEAMCDRDVDRYLVARKATIKQFNEIGEQLKCLGRAIGDRL